MATQPAADAATPVKKTGTHTVSIVMAVVIFVIAIAAAIYFRPSNSGGSSNTQEQYAVEGNNGATTCAIYCTQNVNSQLPKEWKGAYCIETQPTPPGSTATAAPQPCMWLPGGVVKCLCGRNDGVPFSTS